MFTEKQEGVKTRPTRRRMKDNPYDIYVVKKANGEMGYLVHFRNGTYKDKWININGTLYAMLDQFEREDLRYLNELERHQMQRPRRMARPYVMLDFFCVPKPHIALIWLTSLVPMQRGQSEDARHIPRQQICR